MKNVSVNSLFVLEQLCIDQSDFRIWLKADYFSVTQNQFLPTYPRIFTKLLLLYKNVIPVATKYVDQGKYNITR